MGVLGNSAGLLFNAVAGLYLLAVLLRFLLQIARADFYNPVSQAVVKITDPMVRVFRGFIPGFKGIDFATLVLACVIQGVSMCVLIMLYGGTIPGPGFIVTWAVIGTLYYITNIYFFALLASIIMSFVMMFSGNMHPHPALQLVWQLTEPIMAPVRKVIPPMGGLDFSPIFVFLGIQFVQSLLVGAAGVSSGLQQVVLGM
jgi:YggT family protein